MLWVSWWGGRVRHLAPEDYTLHQWLQYLSTYNSPCPLEMQRGCYIQVQAQPPLRRHIYNQLGKLDSPFRPLLVEKSQHRDQHFITFLRLHRYHSIKTTRYLGDVCPSQVLMWPVGVVRPRKTSIISFCLLTISSTLHYNLLLSNFKGSLT